MRLYFFETQKKSDNKNLVAERMFMKNSMISAGLLKPKYRPLSVPRFEEGSQSRAPNSPHHTASVPVATTTPEPPAIFVVTFGRALYNGRAADSCRMSNRAL